MTKFEFYLNREDTDRLFELKDQQRKFDLTGNDYARELLETILHQLHPQPAANEDDY